MGGPSNSADQNLNRVRGWLRDLAIAGVFLTRLPLRVSGEFASKDLSRVAWAFPLVGLFVGVISGGALMAAAELNLHPLACAFIALAASALVTGALHEDGLADVIDGFGGGSAREDKLRIMRDSHIGTYGVLALVIGVGLKAALLAGLLGPGMAAASLLAAAVLSRSILPAMMSLMPRARADGLAVGVGRPNGSTATAALVLGLVIATPFLGLWAVIIAFAAVLISSLIMAYIADRQIGGYTGDVLGATQQIAEVSVLVVAGAFAI